MSATEWIDSAIIDVEPVTRNAANFATAIPRLARNAAKIARRARARWLSLHSGVTIRSQTMGELRGRHRHESAPSISTGLCLLMWPMSAL